MIALESVHNFAPQDRVPDSNREQFAHMCLDEASMLGIQSLDSLKSRLSALQFPACVHPIYEGMIEFVRTHIVLLSLVPNALEELYAYYLTHSSESISAEIAV